jgi:hypothetical protein
VQLNAINAHIKQKLARIKLCVRGMHLIVELFAYFEHFKGKKCKKRTFFLPKYERNLINEKCAKLAHKLVRVTCMLYLLNL